MKSIIFNCVVFLCLLFNNVYGQTVTIQINTSADRNIISPYIYGRNYGLSQKYNNNPPLDESKWQLYRDAGFNIFRLFRGNNGTKHNWEKKLASHPDYYNNVYFHDWQFEAHSLEENLPGVKGFYCFQLLGWVASTTQYNSSGGGECGGGDYTKYTEAWPLKKNVDLLDHWFNEEGLSQDVFEYWSMDGEPEIWGTTHDDVPSMSAPEFMDRYIEVAKLVKKKYPNIKLLGPVAANEWYWFYWNMGPNKDTQITEDGKTYCWLEYFIKRIGEAQKESGIRLLDVLDLHYYPWITNVDQILQSHRTFFDKDYDNPNAGGIKGVNGGWDNSITKEYIFARCDEWMNKYLGANHGVNFALTEMDIKSNDANVNAIWYASTLGEFSKHNVEIFTPWVWKNGMYEVVNLFTEFAKPVSVQSTSSNEEFLSGYASISEDGDSTTLIIVNRSQSKKYTVKALIDGFSYPNGSYKAYTLHNLPSSETFKNDSDNALKESSATVNSNGISIQAEPMSVTAILIPNNNIQKGPVATFTIEEPITSSQTTTIALNFDQSIKGLEISDFTVTNGTIQNMATVTDGLKYSITIHATSTGTVAVSLPANSVTNNKGIGNAVANASYTYDLLSNSTVLLSGISVYPNPTNDVLFIDTQEKIKIDIINMLGTKVYSDQIETSTQIDISQFLPGLYYMVVEENNMKNVIKLIKK